MNKEDLKLAFTYVGALVGAGFASGQELVKFFVNFGSYGLWGVILAGISFALIGSGVIYLTNKMKVGDYSSLIKLIFPNKFHLLMDSVIGLMLWLGLGIMLTGSATLINGTLQIPTWQGFLLTLILVYISLLWGSQSLLNVNTVLVPILLILAISSSILYLKQPLPCLKENLLNSILPNWWLASFLYVAYNMILGIVVLASLGKEKKNSPLAGAAGGLLIGGMAYLMVKGMLLLPDIFKTAEMPMLVMTESVHPIAGQLYSFGLWAALFTTAIANVHSLTVRITNRANISYRTVLIIILLTSVCFLPWKFSLLVGLIYPFMGYVGIPLIIGILIQVIKLTELRW